MSSELYCPKKELAICTEITLLSQSWPNPNEIASWQPQALAVSLDSHPPHHSTKLAQSHIYKTRPRNLIAFNLSEAYLQSHPNSNHDISNPPPPSLDQERNRHPPSRRHPAHPLNILRVRHLRHHRPHPEALHLRPHLIKHALPTRHARPHLARGPDSHHRGHGDAMHERRPCSTTLEGEMP